jgi:hypothetical protein
MKKAIPTFKITSKGGAKGKSSLIALEFGEKEYKI